MTPFEIKYSSSLHNLINVFINFVRKNIYPAAILLSDEVNIKLYTNFPICIHKFMTRFL